MSRSKNFPGTAVAFRCASEGIGYEKIADFCWEALAGINPKVVPAGFDGVGFDPYRLIHDQFAGRHIVLPAVPRTCYGHSVKFPLPERPPAVQAGVVDSVELVSDVRNGKRQAIDLKFPDGPRGNLVFPSGAHK